MTVETVTVKETISLAVLPTDLIACYFSIKIESLGGHGFTVNSSDLVLATPPATYTELFNYQASDSPTEWIVSKQIEFVPDVAEAYKITASVACMGHYIGGVYLSLDPADITYLAVQIIGSISGNLGQFFDYTHSQSFGGRELTFDAMNEISGGGRKNFVSAIIEMN
jgi:hypothetical protein